MSAQAYNLPTTKDELAILKVCVDMAGDARVGNAIRERFFKAVDNLKTKLLIAGTYLKEDEPTVYKCRFEA